MEASDITDEMLTAFLDGETDPETTKTITALMTGNSVLAARLDRLKIPKPTIQEAFDRTMEAAPRAKLDALFQKPPSIRTEPDGGSWLRRGLPLALAATFAAFVIGLSTGRLMLPPDSRDDWRIAVAEYQALYSRETLSSDTPDPFDAENSILSVAAKVGAPIQPEMLVSLDRLTFKRAQILRWGSEPLAQFAFLSDLGEPFALCMTPVLEGDQPINNQELRGLAVSSWVQSGLAYMVIGGSDPVFATAVAEQVRAQL